MSRHCLLQTATASINNLEEFIIARVTIPLKLKTQICKKTKTKKLVIYSHEPTAMEKKVKTSYIIEDRTLSLQLSSPRNPEQAVRLQPGTTDTDWGNSSSTPRPV